MPGMTYVPAADRYEQMRYRRCGRSGLKLPEMSLGLWQNFGEERPLEHSRSIVRRAFDLGITHFDLANNYGPPYGSAERVFGEIMARDLRPHRDELVVSTKAGYDMWPGPYGDWGSRKYLLASLDQSLAAHGPRVRRHLLLAPRRSGHAARGDDGRARHGGEAGQGAVRGDLVLLGPADRRGGADPARPRHAAADPPAVVLAAQPLDRGGPARRARRRGRRRDRVLAARPGDAHDEVPRRDPRGLARGSRERLALPRPPHRRGARATSGR